MTTTLEPPTVATRAVRGRAVVLVALSLTFGLVQLDATIVNVALPTVRTDLGGGLGLAQWLVDGYAVPFAACRVAAGAVGDRLGHRRTCVGGFALFALASLAAALAPGWSMLIAARVVQGAGAAMVLPASLALVGALYPDAQERARALGVWGGIATTGFAAGPVVGGLLLAHASWPWIFWVNLPVCVVLAAVIGRLAPTDRPVDRPVDRIGSLLAGLALAGVVAGIIEAGQGRLGWAVLLGLAGLTLAAAFLAVERRVEHPLVPAALARRSSFRGALVTGFCFNVALYGGLLVVSLVLQERFGLSALGAGVAVLPMAVVVNVGATSSGFLTAAYGPRRPMVGGLLAGMLGAVLLAGVAVASSVALVVVAAGVIGLVSFCMPAMTSVALGAADPGQAGVASGALNAVRQAGGAAGVALLGAALNAGGYDVGLLAAALLVVGALAVGLVAALAAPRVRS